MSRSHLTAGWAALERGDWLAARESFEAASASDPSPEVLDGLGQALWWLKRPVDGMELRMRAYSEYRSGSRYEEAARIAVWLAREHRALFTNAPAAEGWLARAEGLVPRLTDTSVPGWVLLARAESLPDVSGAIENCRRVLALAHEYEDGDLEVRGLALLGVLEIASGLVDEGIGHLDEAMAAASAGEGADLQTLGEAYCALMEAGDLLGDMERVTSWSHVLSRYGGSDLGPLTMQGAISLSGALSAFCGACCGGIYMVTGRLDMAEEELLSSIAELEGAGLRSRCVHPVSQLAEIRIAQGRLEEARFLLTEFEDLPEAVRPLAMLDLASGNAAEAIARLRRRIEQTSETPVLAFPLWLLLVDAHLSMGDITASAAAVAEAERVAALTRSLRHQGYALLARGKVEAAQGDDRAPHTLKEAARTLGEASLYLMSSRARMELARSLMVTDAPLAIAEARAALAAFERLGASPDADAAAAFLRQHGVKGRTGAKEVGLLSNRETEVLRLVGQGLSNAEIAERLFISVKTVGHHASSILSKLGLRSRTEAAAFAAINLGRDPVPK